MTKNHGTLAEVADAFVALHIRTEPTLSMFIRYAHLIPHFCSHHVVISQAMYFYLPDSYY